MNQQQLERMQEGKGFIAALDQSGGSTPKALANYGVEEGTYKNVDEMFQMVHDMRTRIIKSKAFNSDRILAAILFEHTLDNKIDGQYTAEYLWNEKKIVPFLKVDKGLAEEKNGVQMMKPMPELDALLKKAVERGIFGTKMRSVIKENNPDSIKKIVAQQFDIGKQIIAAGLVPIIEPEVDIHSKEKEKIEETLKQEILDQLNALLADQKVMLKLTLPNKVNDYKELIDHPNVIRVVALSGGYSREESNEKLKQNQGLIASFSRALTEGLNINQSDEEFDTMFDQSIESIYQASLS